MSDEEDVVWTQLKLAALAQQALSGRAVWRQDLREWWMCSQSRGYWSAEDREGVQDIVMNSVFEVKPTATLATINSVTGLLKPVLSARQKDFDRESLLLGVQGGVIDLETFKLRDIEPSMHLTKSANVPYVPKAPAPNFEAHVLQLFDGNAELAEFLQRCVGSALVGDSSMKPQIYVFLVGGSGRGKGTMMRTLGRVLGQHQVPIAARNMTYTSAGKHQQWLRAFRNARLAVIEEMRAEAIDVALLKTLSGGDPMIANAMRQNDETWLPTHTLFFTSQQMPNFHDEPSGQARRFTPLELGPDIPPELTDENYERRFDDELTGILAWAVEGCRKWRGDGKLLVPTKVSEDAAAHIAEQSTVGQFIEEVLQVTGDHQDELTRVELRRCYEQYFVAKSHRSPSASDLNNLYSKLAAMGAAAGHFGPKGDQQRGFRGVRLKA